MNLGEMPYARKADEMSTLTFNDLSPVRAGHQGHSRARRSAKQAEKERTPEAVRAAVKTNEPSPCRHGSLPSVLQLLPRSCLISQQEMGSSSSRPHHQLAHRSGRRGDSRLPEFMALGRSGQDWNNPGHKIGGYQHQM